MNNLFCICFNYSFIDLKHFIYHSQFTDFLRYLKFKFTYGNCGGDNFTIVIINLISVFWIGKRSVWLTLTIFLFLVLHSDIWKEAAVLHFKFLYLNLPGVSKTREVREHILHDYTGKLSPLLNYGGKEVQKHAFLNLLLVGGQRLISHHHHSRITVQNELKVWCELQSA